MKKGLISLFSIVVLLICWEFVALSVDLPDLFPTVPGLAKTLFELFSSETFYLSVTATLLRGITGLFLSVFAAAGIAFLFSRNELLYELFRPLLAIMRSVPVISFILLALIFLNPESIPLLIAFLTMFPLLTENLTEGIRSQRKGLSVMARQFGIGWYNRLTQIVYPELKPFLYSGLASASGFGWRAIIMGEVLAQCDLGIGGEMKRAQTFISVPELTAWTIIAVLISFFFDKGIGWLGKQSFPIRYSPAGSWPVQSKGPEIQLTDISFKYGNTSIFSHYSRTFGQGRIYGLTAPSGYGKTTLLHLIGSILTPQNGCIRFTQPGNIATVFQKPELLDPLTVTENIAFPLATFADKETALGHTSALLREMELEDLGNRHPYELSFGQQQRVAIARALAYPASLLLMDEPFKGLDERLSRHIAGYIRKRQADNSQTIIFTSHNAKELDQMADEIIQLNENWKPVPDGKES